MQAKQKKTTKRRIMEGVLLLALGLPIVFGGVVGASNAAAKVHQHQHLQTACVTIPPFCW